MLGLFRTIARGLRFISWRRVAALSALTLGLVPNGAQGQARLVINDVTVQEPGGVGTNIATFTVSFADTTPHGAVTVLYSTTNGTATGGGGGSQCGSGMDYVSVAGAALSFTATQSTQQILIPLCGDARYEGNETFSVVLTSATGAAIQDGQAQAIINDDDVAPRLSVANVTVTEGNAPNTVNAVFTVTMTGLTDLQANASYATANGSAIGGATCVAGIDYLSRNGTVNFPASPANQDPSNPTATQQITVQVCGDAVYEGQQQFQLRLTNPANATFLGQGTATGSIADNETPPQLRITTPNVAVTEPADPTQVTPANFTVELAGTPFEGSVSVSFATSSTNVVGDPAEAGNCSGSFFIGIPTVPISKADYCARFGTLTFAQLGQRVITIDVRGDQHVETAELFRVTLANAQRAVIVAGQGTGTATIAASP